MTMRSSSTGSFVKSTVLKSVDGVAYSQEEAVTTDDAVRQRIAAEREAATLSAGGSLYDQLQARKEEQDEAWTAKHVHQPPAGLDEDEAGYLNDIRSDMVKAEMERRARERNERAAFESAVREQTVSMAEVPKVEFNRNQLAIIDDTDAQRILLSRAVRVRKVLPKRKRVRADSENSTLPKKATQSTALGLVRAYASSSDDE